jgi:hypothetical protein
MLKNIETARGERREARGEAYRERRGEARGESGVDSEFRQRRCVRLLRWWRRGERREARGETLSRKIRREARNSETA